MANKDVKLIIRARDEASKTLDSVAQSLNKVDAAQEKVSRSAKSTDANMTGLGDEVGKLAAKLDGLRELGQVARTLKGIETAISNMESGVRKSAEAFDKFSKEAQEAAQRVVQLRAESAQLTDTYARQKAETDAARQATLKGAEATRAMARAKKELDALTAKGTDAAGIEKATAAYRAAETAVERNRQVHQRLQAELNQTSADLAGVNANLRASEKNYGSLISQTERFAESTKEGEAALNQTREAFTQLEQRADGAAKALGVVSARQGDVEKATESTTQALRENEAVLKTMQRYSTGGGSGFADPKLAATLRTQREEMERVRQGWQALEGDIQRQAVAMRGLEQPTQAQISRMRETVAAARAAKNEYSQLQGALARTQGSLQSSFSAWERGSTVLQRFANEARRIPSSPPVQPWNNFFSRIRGDSRQALGFMQRLRGEVIALATAYVGLYGAINQIGGVIEAYQKLEAAQNRLGVVFSQNGAAVTKELGFLERQAARLGIEFGTLADQYSKFAIAANSGNFSLAGTREVFLGVAEAGRVAKLSTEQLGGVFTALEQIISKGKVQSEELRHQLGDRLPGAFSIMARALGKTTAELDEMMEKGEVIANEDTLLKFAQELERQFGAQLPKALESTTTLLGRFANSIFQAQTQVGRGGFIEGLNKALIELDKWFKSREGRDFFLALGAALGKFAVALAEIPKYFGLIQNAVQLLVGIKLSQWILQAVGNLGKMEAATVVSAARFQSWSAVVGAAGAKLTILKTGITSAIASVTNFTGTVRTAGSVITSLPGKINVGRAALTALNATLAATARGFNLLWAAVGGWPGVIITGATLLITELLGNWIGGVDDATSKIDEHQRILTEVLTTYEQLAGATKNWADEIENVSLAQTEGNFLNQADLYKQAIADLQGQIRNWDSGGLATALNRVFSNDQVNRIRDMVKSFDGTNVEEFVDSLRELNAEISDPAAKKGIIELLEYAEATLTAKGRMEEAAAVARVKGSVLEGLNVTTEDATAKLEEMTGASEEGAEAMDKGSDSVRSYADVLTDLKGIIPGVADEMERLKNLTTLDTASLAAAAASLREMGSIGPALDLYGQGMAAITAESMKPFSDAMGSATGALEKSAALLRKFEGFRETPYWDVNAFRVGFGSDTITLADGTIRRVTEGMRVSVADANRDLIRRIGEFQSVVKGQIGANRFAQFSEEQQAALTSIAYNYGSLPDRIIEAVRSGSSAEISQAIRSLRGDNDGVNAKRRDAESFLFTPGGRNVEDEVKVAQDAADARQKAADATKETLANTEAELARQQMITLGNERQLAIREAINKAIKDDPSISPEELGKLADLTGKIWDEENVNRVKKAEAEATAARIEGMEFEVSNQELINQGLERQAAIETAIREAREENPGISDAEIARITELTGRTYDLQQAEKSRTAAAEAAEARVNQLLEHRRTLQETLQLQMASGDTVGAEATRSALQGINTELQTAIEKAIAMWAAIGGPEADLAIAKLQQTKLEISAASTGLTLFGLSTQQWSGLIQNFASGLTGVFATFAQAIANGENAIEALGRAFLEFAANFLIEIGKMIIQQAILNALQGFLGGFGGGGGGGGLPVPFGHTGGLVGSKTIGSGNSRKNLLANIPYFHDGGVVGLKADEQLAVLRKNEEVLTENDPRHIFNGAGSSGPTVMPAPVVKVVNSFDSGDVVSEGMNTPVGEQTFLNIVRKNARDISAILQQ